MPSSITWRTQYDYEADQIAREQSNTVNTEPSMTQRHHADDADINTIVRRFGITDGAVPPAALDPSFFGDFSDVPDMRTALDQVRTAENRFRELPADLRRRFANSPAELYEFVNNPENAEEAVELGLLKKRPEPVQQAPATEPAPPPATQTPTE